MHLSCNMFSCTATPAFNAGVNFIWLMLNYASVRIHVDGIRNLLLLLHLTRFRLSWAREKRMFMPVGKSNLLVASSCAVGGEHG